MSNRDKLRELWADACQRLQKQHPKKQLEFTEKDIRRSNQLDIKYTFDKRPGNMILVYKDADPDHDVEIYRHDTVTVATSEVGGGVVIPDIEGTGFNTAKIKRQVRDEIQRQVENPLSVYLYRMDDLFGDWGKSHEL